MLLSCSAWGCHFARKHELAQLLKHLATSSVGAILQYCHCTLLGCTIFAVTGILYIAWVVHIYKGINHNYFSVYNYKVLLRVHSQIIVSMCVIGDLRHYLHQMVLHAVVMHICTYVITMTLMVITVMATSVVAGADVVIVTLLAASGSSHSSQNM